MGEDDNRSEGKRFSNDERDKLVSYISESIQNFSLKIDRKGKQCRYSSHDVNLSMSLYLKNIDAYKEIRETKGMSCPSPNMLYDKQSVFKLSPGVDSSSM